MTAWRRGQKMTRDALTTDDRQQKSNGRNAKKRNNDISTKSGSLKNSFEGKSFSELNAKAKEDLLEFMALSAGIIEPGE